MSAPLLLLDEWRGLLRCAAIQNRRLCGLWLQEAEPRQPLAGGIWIGRRSGEQPISGRALYDCGAGHVIAALDTDVTGSLPLQVMAEASRSPLLGRDKPARGSAALSLAGRYLVHLPERKPGDLPEALAGMPGGWILRRKGREADAETLRQEADWLQAAMAELQQAVAERDGTVGRCLSGPSVLLQAYAEAPFAMADAELLYSGKAAEAAWQAFHAKGPVGDIARAYNDPALGLFDAYDMEAAVEALLQPVTEFTGGRLVCEHTEAMTVFDIDLADRSAQHAALEALARQVGMRQLSGTVVIDWPRLPDAAKTLKRLSGLLKQNPQPVTVHGFSRNGLIELSIPRRRRMLHEIVAVAAG
jgi:Rne/Rng family ribonuclease